MMADVLDIVEGAGKFTTLVKLLRAAGMVGKLKGTGPVTLFAPTDNAFDRLPAGMLENLLPNSAQLRWLLAYHLVMEGVTSAGMKSRHVASLVSSEGESITLVRSTTGHLRANNMKITRADILADNGIIHVLDGVMLPRSTSVIRAR